METVVDEYLKRCLQKRGKGAYWVLLEECRGKFGEHVPSWEMVITRAAALGFEIEDKHGWFKLRKAT
jgi:hypothetical protein